MAERDDLTGYIFVALPDPEYEWDATVELVPGRAEEWTEVPAGKVTVGKPVWILQCGQRAKSGRGFYGLAETIEPRAPRTDLAWLRYAVRFDKPILLPSGPNQTHAALGAVRWQDNRLPILLGIRPDQNGVTRPCGFVGTVFPVGGQDEHRIRQLLPGLPPLSRG